MKKILNFTVLILFCCVSCNKYSDKRNFDDLSKMNSINFINPYNYIGIHHNNALTQIGNSSNFDSLSNDQIYYLIKQYCISNYNYSFSNIYNDIVEEINISQFAIDSFNIWSNQLFVQGYYDDKTRNFVNEIYGLISDSSKNLLDTNIVYFEMAKIEKRIVDSFGFPQITSINDRILDFSNDEDKVTYLLIGCAIAKYSFAFWGNAYYQSTPWSPQLEATGLFDRIGKWFGRAAADVGGFFSNPTHGPSDIGFGHKWTWNIWDAIENSKTASANKRIQQNGGVTE